ncbi:hypothetical protein OS493_033218 [Desmophyllum pertusum]|uniref:MADF domain-containing protein n=1 Tax=Desmophyllum pertusum TaxID=174260 RepID=A0A9X0CCZ5_9CNID|nr:hypothetical protein OS493_033218 [Desmophyllum pertusum]
MAASDIKMDEKLAEAVRKYPVLYDKSCSHFKDSLKKHLGWEDVAKMAGLQSRIASPETRKKLKPKRFLKDVEEVKQSTSGPASPNRVCMYVCIRLHVVDRSNVKPRKTKSNVFNVDTNRSEDEEEEEEEDDQENDEDDADGSCSPAPRDESAISLNVKETKQSNVTGRAKFRKKPR